MIDVLLGISVCSVSGTNFVPFVKLLGCAGLNIPMTIMTDYDPYEGASLGIQRAEQLYDILRPGGLNPFFDESQIRNEMESCGIFVGDHTLEIDIFHAGGHHAITQTLTELTKNGAAKKRAEGWCNMPMSIDPEQLLKDLSVIGKGRFAQALAGKLTLDSCPPYIKRAISHAATGKPQ